MKNVTQEEYDYIIALGFKEDKDPFMGECFNSIETHDISNLPKIKDFYSEGVPWFGEPAIIEPIVSKYMIVKSSSKGENVFHVFYNEGKLKRLGLVPIEKISKTLKTI